MPAVSISPQPKLQFFDANGNPLSGGKLYSYDAGTTTPRATYTDSTGSIANANPVILNTRGEASVWLDSSPYKLALYTASDVLIWTVDGLNGGTTGINASGNGTQTVFSVSFAPKAIYINGVYQNKNTYSINAGNVTFSQAPPQTSVIEFLI